MAEFSPLEVSAWIKKLGPSFKDALVPLGLSCIFPYHQIKVDEPLLHAATNFWISSRHVFHFNNMEICPTLEEFSAIMGEPNVSTLILPTIGNDFADLAHDLLGISLATSQQWCMLDHLNIHMVFAFFSRFSVPVTGRGRSHYLNAFCLWLLARYFLVNKTYRVDQRMCLVVNNLDKGSLVGMILVETLNGLDVVHREEATFFIGNALLLQVRSLIFT